MVAETQVNQLPNKPRSVKFTYSELREWLYLTTGSNDIECPDREKFLANYEKPAYSLAKQTSTEVHKVLCHQYKETESLLVNVGDYLVIFDADGERVRAIMTDPSTLFDTMLINPR